MDQLMTHRGRHDAEQKDSDLEGPLLLPDVHLHSSSVGEERLQVHMDCMNAAGEVVAIEDVDDMGGAVSYCDTVVFRFAEGYLFPFTAVLDIYPRVGPRHLAGPRSPLHCHRCRGRHLSVLLTCSAIRQ